MSPGVSTSTDDVPAASVTVFGGTGFVDREIVKHLVEMHMAVRVAARHYKPCVLDGYAGHVGFVEADVRDHAAVVKAVEGASAVVNAVGLYVERGVETFQSVHVSGALNVARAAARAAVGQFVHLSGIGASADSPSAYVRARAEGERCVESGFGNPTIVRPSVVFGPDDALLGGLDAMTRVSPVVPLFGRGSTRLQPVYVGDVALAVARLSSRQAASGHVFELGGPRVYTYRELLETVLAHRRRRRLLMPVPFALWAALARALAVLPNPPLTADQVVLMRGDNVVGDGAATTIDLGIAARSLEALLPLCLPASPPHA